MPPNPDRLNPGVWFLSVLTLLLLALIPRPCAGGPAHEIKLASLAPENSSSMQIFNEMDLDLRAQTGGRVGFKIYGGFALGNEMDVLRKLRIGYVQAAVFTTASLSDLNPDMRVLQIPFLFNTYDEVDQVLGSLAGDFEQGFAAQGFEILGWSELGFVYLMSRSPIARIADFKGQRVWAVAGSRMAKVLFDRAGVSPVTISAPDVLLSLQTKSLNVVYNSPYYALVTQWYSRIKYLTDLPLIYGVSVLMIDKKIFDRLPADDRQTLKTICSKHMRRLTVKTRQDNAEALQVMFRRGITRVTPEADAVTAFKQLSEAAMDDLGPKFLPPQTVKAVRTSLDQYRSGIGEKR